MAGLATPAPMPPRSWPDQGQPMPIGHAPGATTPTSDGQGLPGALWLLLLVLRQYTGHRFLWDRCSGFSLKSWFITLLVRYRGTFLRRFFRSAGLGVYFSMICAIFFFSRRRWLSDLCCRFSGQDFGNYPLPLVENEPACGSNDNDNDQYFYHFVAQALLFYP